MSPSITVLLADDHPLVRESLAHRIGTEPGFTVVAQVTDAAEAVERTVALKPALVVLDIDMPGLHSFDAAEIIRQRCPDTRITFLSAHTHDQYVQRALTIGAAAYITKTESTETIIRALRTVASGGIYFSQDIEDRIVFAEEGIRTTARSRAATLTAQQIRILQYLAKGMSKKEIAGVTSLSERTVNRHVENLMARLNIHDRVELTRFAIREGLAQA